MTKTNDIEEMKETESVRLSPLQDLVPPLSFKWGKHKHRRFINGEDGDLPDCELQLQPLPEVAPSMPATSPWNLRTGNGNVTPEIDEKKTSTPVKKRTGLRSKRIQSKMAKKEAVLNLVVPLSKSEIEEDFLKMIGKKPPTRPKKRTRAVQRELDTLFPGLRLSEIPCDRYDVPESLSCTEKVQGIMEV